MCPWRVALHVDTFDEQRNCKDNEIDDLDTIAKDNLNPAEFRTAYWHVNRQDITHGVN
jgi:hypothetical protein